MQAARCLVALMATLSVPAADLAPALRSIQAADLESRTRTLSTDAFEGRAPGTPGEERTVQFLIEHFRGFGLEPGHTGGQWTQEVPLVGITSQVQALHRSGDTTEPWIQPQDFVAWSPRLQTRVTLPDTDLVFVGYGVVAPEYQWDDFKDVDVRGRTVVMLVNDPPVEDPAQAGRLDPAVFRGSAMTYYGRWTYKFEIAAARGAAAALVVHETGPAGYPYFVVVNSWGRENFDLRSADGNAGKVPVSGWLSLDRARRLFAASGLPFEEAKRRAVRRDFRPVPLAGRLSFEVTNTLREVTSRNVLARLPGSDPARRHEQVIYSAHWDHLGRDARLPGDQVFNGALDNASGTAVMLEIAEAFARLAPADRPPRSILFLATTAEEQGLLGARHYAQHPTYPLRHTLANLNIDGANVSGRRRDVGVVGHGLTTLEEVLRVEAAAQQRTVRPESEPEKGGYFRSDHFEFARVGVPALYLDATSDDILDHPSGYGRQRREEYRENDYHKVSDEMKPWWDFSGAVEDAQLLFRVGYVVAQGETWPEWKPGAEFKARREMSLNDSTGTP